MRTLSCTLLPMLIAAVLVVVAGEKFSRQEVAERTPYDRERLLDFSDQLFQESERLEALFQKHLSELATIAQTNEEFDIRAAAEPIVGLHSIRIFRERHRDLTVQLLENSPTIPEVELEGRKPPLKPEQAVLLSKELIEKELSPEGIWIVSLNPTYRVFCQKPNEESVMACLFDFAKIKERVQQQYLAWVAEPALPLTEANERVQVTYLGETFLQSGSDQRGPAAAIIPYRTLFGDLEIRAWDGVTVTQTRDPAIVAMTASLAFLLLASGIFLFLQMRKTLRLASERVSFVNRVSHELGSPLTNLALNLDLATESLDHDPARAKMRLGLVTEEIERLSRLVANVLTFSRRERKTLELTAESVDVCDLVSEVVESFRPALERRGISIELDLPSPVRAELDPDALRQIVGNLLSNVEKYAATGKWVRLCVTQREEEITITATDRGPGISAKDSERIFQPFERVHSGTSEGSSGTGLGLALGRELASRMGGTLELLENSSHDAGCTFQLTLPTKTSPAATP